MEEMEKVEKMEKEETEEMVGLKCISKAMEIPLVSGITGTITATTNYISTTKHVSMVTEKIKTVGGREDVKNMINSVNTLYQNNLSESVENLKDTLNPTLKNLDNYACSGIDRVNEKVADTKEYYVDPVMSRVTETRELYVDPVVERATNIKENTAKKVSECREQVNSVRTNYVNPAINQAASMKDNYVNPAIDHAKQAVEDPTKAYVQAVDYGTQVLLATKEAGLTKATEVVETARNYLATTRDTAAAQVYAYINQAKDSASNIVKTSVDQAITYAKLNRVYAVQKAASLLEEARESIRVRYPTVGQYLDTGAATIKTVAQRASSTAITVVSTSRTVASRLGEGYEWTKTSVAATRDTLHSAASGAMEVGEQFTKTNESTIRSVANMVGLSSYLGVIGLDEKQKTC